jgi:hypothetical protein
MLRTKIFALVFFGFSVLGFGQRDTTSIDKKRLTTLVIAASAGYTGGLATLNHVWYKDTGRQSFRFFNDNAEWKQLDKAGHSFASFHLGMLTSKALSSCDVPEKKADLYGAIAGFVLTLPIEVFDGYSDGYGASMGDVVADAAGPALFLSQKLLWKEIRIHPKFSFQRTHYAALRPQLLGDNRWSEIVKDYNGQTYWLSVDLDKFTTFPRWLNLAVGYGASDMIYARDAQNQAAGFDPYRQYYLAFDFDLTSIRTRSKFVKTLIYMVNTVRLPAPAIEFSSRGSKFHPFYF